MTRKHFVLLAAALARSKPVSSPPATVGIFERVTAERQWRTDCAAIADCLAETNGAFDRARFLRACEGAPQ